MEIDMAKIEQFHKYLVEHVDPKYAGIIDPGGIDSLKREIAKYPELKKFFKMEDSEEEK